MIKLTNILNENKGTTLNLVTLPNRKICNAFITMHPEIPERLKTFLQYKQKVFQTDYVYRTLNDFIKDKIGITDRNLIIEIAILILINPNVKDFINEELNDGSNVYVTSFEYSEDDYHVYEEEDEVDCPECNGATTEECRECEGIPKRHCECGGEDETCTYCDGTGEFECDYCGGEGEIACRYCDGYGFVDEVYELYELEYHKILYLSFGEMEVDMDFEEGKGEPNIETQFIEAQKNNYIIWSDYLWSETDRDGDYNISYDINSLIDLRDSKLSNWKISTEL